jgi:hypothetical protein
MAVAITRRELSARDLRASGFGGEDDGCEGGAAHAGNCAGDGGEGPQDRSRELRDGPADLARPGPSLQRRRAGGSVEPPLGRASAAVEFRAEGGACANGAGGARPRRGRGGAACGAWT